MFSNFMVTSYYSANVIIFYILLAKSLYIFSAGVKGKSPL